ncbi:MAG: DegT/DnrJ/EryC1/StrS family aminotransferase [Parachlamydiaceae bacterium]
MTNDFIPYARQSISPLDGERMVKALNSPFITRGPCVEEFERAIANNCGARFAVAFNSASTALHAAFHAAKITRFDRLISTPNTYVATIGPGVHYFQAKPTFCDIDPSTGNIDINKVEVTLNQKSSRGRPILLPVHFGGIALDMAALDNLIKNSETIVIEDAAHALGSFYPDGRPVGCCDYSQMTIFSFHPAKTLTTGEGGMVTTNDATLYENLRRFRNNGIDARSGLNSKNYRGFYEVQEITGNFNFTEFQAALGLSQLERFDDFVHRRRKLVGIYRSLLKGIPGITLFTDRHDTSTAFHLCVAQIDFDLYKTSRKEVIETLYQQGIGTQVHYIPVYRHPYFVKHFGEQSEFFPEMENYYSKALTLPLYYDLAFEDVEKVVDSLLRVLQARKSR